MLLAKLPELPVKIFTKIGKKYFIISLGLPDYDFIRTTQILTTERTWLSLSKSGIRQGYPLICANPNFRRTIVTIRKIITLTETYLRKRGKKKGQEWIRYITDDILDRDRVGGHFEQKCCRINKVKVRSRQRCCWP